MQLNGTAEVDFEKIDIDPFWNVGHEKEHKIHRIHAYPAKFPAFITQKAISFAHSNEVEVNDIADIFCGCGTVAYEAKRYGIDFWGCDINPVAVLIAKAKSYSYSNIKIKLYTEEIIRNYIQLYDTYSYVPDSSKDRILYWFDRNTINKLSLLKKCILATVPKSSKYRYYFLCAFSNILKPTSRWLTKSIKPQVDPNKVPADVLEAFIKQCGFMSKAVKEAVVNNEANVTIKKRNALAIKKNNFVDLIITSPPYVTSYEYADLHQLSALWLNFADDYRDLRINSVGSNHNTQSSSLGQKNLNRYGGEVVEMLSNVDKPKANAVAKYLLDIQSVTTVCHNILRENGMALFVIGNTEYKGVQINNAKHLAESLYNSGFEEVHITKRKITQKILTPYRDPNGRFSSHTTDRKVYAEEFILVGRK